MLLEGWKEFERQYGEATDVEKVQAMMPIVSRKQRKVDELGDNLEECELTNASYGTDAYVIHCIADWDMVFPDDEREANPASFKFLEMAHKWKRMQQSGDGNSKPLSLPSVSKTEQKMPSVSGSNEKSGSEGDGDAEMASSDDEN